MGMPKRRIGIFGSTVREETSEERDIDVVVEFERTKPRLRVCGPIDFSKASSVEKLTSWPRGNRGNRLEHIKEEIKRSVE